MKSTIALKKLRDLGNTVIVVEYDIETMENSDHIIDIGAQLLSKTDRTDVARAVKEIIKNENRIVGNYLFKNYSNPKKKTLSKKRKIY